MPYACNEDLPPNLRRLLPPHAQSIFRSAFNHAWAHYRERRDREREEVAHRVAWAAVKRHYRKHGEQWVPLESFPEQDAVNVLDRVSAAR